MDRPMVVGVIELEKLEELRAELSKMKETLAAVMAQSEHDTIAACLLWDEYTLPIPHGDAHVDACTRWVSAERSRRALRLRGTAPAPQPEPPVVSVNAGHEAVQLPCPHTETIRGHDIPRRYGSYRSAICTACLSFRTMTHHGDPVGPWQPKSEYDKAIAEEE